MGTLDDAIREHLELKRRLGASDDELKEKESEAFGKGSRPAPSEPGPPDAAPVDAEPEPAGEGEPFEEHDVAAAEPTPNGHAPESGWDAVELGAPPAPTRTVDEIFEPDEVPVEEALDPELRVRDERPAPEPDTAEHADAWAEEPAQAADEDVLEETPEFLEETPEQDRLWFEQRPPKDFDFD